MPDEPVSDSELIDRWRRGDELAAAELVRRHARAVARFLSAAGGGEDVEDLVQETFYRAFRRIDTFRGGASFRTWVMTIGSNALKDLSRKRRRRPELALPDHDFPGSQDPHSDLVERDLETLLQREIGRLPPMQRDVFLLRAQQGAEYEDVAAALGTTIGAARVHYHHAAQRLKRLLQDRDHK